MGKELICRKLNIYDSLEVMKAIRTKEGEEFDGVSAKKKLIQIVVEICDHEKMGYPSKEDLISDEEMFRPISAKADEMYQKVLEAYEKKD